MKPLSGEKVIKVLCKDFGFEISGQTGSHIRLAKHTSDGKTGTVVPNHKELKIGTLRGVLKLAKIDIEEFYKKV